MRRAGPWRESTRVALALVALAVVHERPALAQSGAVDATSSYSLEQAVAEMEKSHPLLQAAEQIAHAADGDAIDAGLWTNPVLGASYANAWRSSYDSSGNLGATLSQFLELSGAPAARANAARLLASALRGDREGLRVELAFRIEDAAVANAAAQRRVEILRDVDHRFIEVVRIVKARVASGAAPQYDADRIAIEGAAVGADLADAEADALRTRGALRAAIGPGVAHLSGELAYELFGGVTLPPLEALVEQMRSRRPDVLAARARVDAARASVDVARKSVFPGIGVTVGSQYGQGPGQVDLSAGVAIPLPVINRGQGSIPAAQARALASEQSLDALLGPAEVLLQGVRAEVERRQRLQAEYQSRTGLVRENLLSEARSGYEGGRLSVLELSDGYTAWRDARLRAIQIAADARRAEIDLCRLIGSRSRAALAQLSVTEPAVGVSNP